MRLPLSILTISASASVPALAISLSGRISDPSGIGKAGVTVTLQGTTSLATATTDENGAWSLSDGSTGISSRLSNIRQLTAESHLLMEGGHLRVSFSGYDIMGRPHAESAVTAMPAGTASGISARATTSGVDILLYSWNGKTFLRDTASVSRSDIVGTFDTIPNASIIYDWLTDARDNQVYRTVKIGTQTWMANNLNYKVDSSWCYDDSNSNCTKYGRLYQWSAAMDTSSTYNSALLNAALPHQGICPSGWHVPSDAEWGTLIACAGSDSTRIKLSSTSSWDTTYYKGSDSYGFNVLSAGIRNANGAFDELGVIADFWSSSEYSTAAWFRGFGYSYAYVIPNAGSKSHGWSLRCIQN